MKCAECGTEFVPRRETRQIYCGLGCAARVNRRNARQRNRKRQWIKKQLALFREERDAF